MAAFTVSAEVGWSLSHPGRDQRDELQGLQEGGRGRSVGVGDIRRAAVQAKEP